MRDRATGLAIGIVFGATLSWTWLGSPDVIRAALLLRDAHVFLVFASAVAVAWAGLRLAGEGRRAADRPTRRQLGGGVVFGAGWALAGACPGSIAVGLGQGAAWSLFAFVGMVAGIALSLRPDRPRPSSGGFRARR